MSNYTQQKFRLGTRVGADCQSGDTTPGPPVELPLVGGGNCAYVAWGIDAPASWAYHCQSAFVSAHKCTVSYRIVSPLYGVYVDARCVS